MRVLRFALLPLVLILSLCTATSANAESKVADCLELKFPSATATSTIFTLTVKVYATCTEEQIGRGKGQRAVFSMPQEDSLLTLGSCSGPTAQPRVGLSDGLLGTATCSLRVGSNSLPSLRVGATSTTIRMWFSWDFSEKSVSVPHTSIPGSASNGGGGSSSGSSSSSPGLSAPAIKNCVSAPETPLLSINWNEKGPLFKFSPATSGDKATVIGWSFALYDIVKRAWDPWSARKEIFPVTPGEYQAMPESNKSKIAFLVYGTNACGSSDSAREVKTNNGVPLEALVQDDILSLTATLKRVTVGSKVPVTELANSRLKLDLFVMSSTPSICRLMTDDFIEMLDVGECKLVVTSVSSFNKIGSTGRELTLPVLEKSIPARQSILKVKLAKSYNLSVSRIKLSESSSAGLPIFFQSLTEDVCEIDGEFLVLRTKGICDLLLSQDGNEDFLAAEDKFFVTLITDSNRVITCSKGKLTKKVTGLNPKCPVGYKKK